MTTLCVDDSKGAIKAISSSLTGITRASVRSSQMLWHMTGTIFQFTDRLERSDTDSYVRAILFLTSKPPEGGSIVRQCGLSAGEQKFPLILV